MFWILGIVAIVIMVLWIGTKAEINMRHHEDELNRYYRRGK